MWKPLFSLNWPIRRLILLFIAPPLLCIAPQGAIQATLQRASHEHYRHFGNSNFSLHTSSDSRELRITVHIPMDPQKPTFSVRTAACVDNHHGQKSDTDRVQLEQHWSLDLTAGRVCFPCRTCNGKASNMQQHRELKGDVFAGAFMCLIGWVSLSHRLRLTGFWSRLYALSSQALLTLRTDISAHETAVSLPAVLRQQQ